MLYLGNLCNLFTLYPKPMTHTCFSTAWSNAGEQSPLS